MHKGTKKVLNLRKMRKILIFVMLCLSTVVSAGNVVIPSTISSNVNAQAEQIQFASAQQHHQRQMMHQQQEAVRRQQESMQRQHESMRRQQKSMQRQQELMQRQMQNQQPRRRRRSAETEIINEAEKTLPCSAYQTNSTCKNKE